VVGHGETGRAVHQIHGWTLERLGRLVGLECLECLECLEAFPTPSSAVTGMKRGGPSLALTALLYTCRDAPDVGLGRG
jgi:hypothetical protein